MSKDPSIYIRHIYGCIRRIETYTRAGEHEFYGDTKTQDAVIRNLEVIGQAVKAVGPDLLLKADRNVPWDQVAGMRNILAHQYLGIDLKLTWQVVHADIPRLKQAIAATARGMNLDLSEFDSENQS